MQIKKFNVDHIATLPLDVQIKFMQRVVRTLVKPPSRTLVVGLGVWGERPEVQAALMRMDQARREKQRNRFAPD